MGVTKLATFAPFGGPYKVFTGGQLPQNMIINNSWLFKDKVVISGTYESPIPGTTNPGQIGPLAAFSKQGEDNWTPIDPRIVTVLFEFQGKLFGSGPNTNPLELFSTADLVTWTNVGSIHGELSTFRLFGAGIIATMATNPVTLYSSVDGGNWVMVGQVPQSSYGFVQPVNDKILFTIEQVKNWPPPGGVQHSFWLSDDGGTTWHQSNPPGVFYGFVGGSSVPAANDKIVVPFLAPINVAATSGGFYVSRDAGTSWQTIVTASLPEVQFILVSDTLLLANIRYRPGGYTLFISGDLGATFTSIVLPGAGASPEWSRTFYQLFGDILLFSVATDGLYALDLSDAPRDARHSFANQPSC